MPDAATGIRVGLIEDHDIVREGLVALLSADRRFQVVGAASSIGGYLTTGDGWQTDVIVADYRLPDGKGTDLATETNTPILILSGSNARAVLDDAVRTGCAGFASKAQSVADLADKIVVVANGGTVFPADVLRRAMDPTSHAELTPLTARETDILEYLADARSVTEISQELELSQHTVRNHVRAILTKLHARSQLEAVVTAVRAGILELRLD